MATSERYPDNGLLTWQGNIWLMSKSFGHLCSDSCATWCLEKFKVAVIYNPSVFRM